MIVIQLCFNSGVEVTKNEEKVEEGLAISSKTSTEAPQIGGQRIEAEILDDLKEIKIMPKKLLTFMEYQHKQNTFMQGKCDVNQVKTSSVPIFKLAMFASTLEVVIRKKNEEKKDVMAHTRSSTKEID